MHVVWSGEVGGIERVVHDLALAQQRHGLEVSVAFGQFTGPFAAAIARRGPRTVDLALSGGSDLRPSVIRRGAAAMKEAHVVHLHGFNVAIAAIALKAARPTIFTEHGTFGLGRRLGLSGHVKRGIQRLFLEHAVDAITANSAHTADRLSDVYQVPRSRITVIHNGFDAERLAAVAAKPNAALTVVYAGRLVHFKRVELLLRAVAALRPEDANVVLVGDGPLGPELKSLAAEMHLRNVSFLGFRADVDAVLASADVVVQPSEGEPFGLAVLEGTAFGALPIVFSDGGGALEVLPPDGIIVNSVSELAVALKALKDSPAVMHEARARRAAWARQTFNIEKVAGRYIELYRSITNP